MAKTNWHTAGWKQLLLATVSMPRDLLVCAHAQYVPSKFPTAFSVTPADPCKQEKRYENDRVNADILFRSHRKRSRFSVTPVSCKRGLREEGGSGAAPHRSFENQLCNIDILYIILKGIIWRSRFNLNFSKIFWFRDFMSKFSRNDSPNGSGVSVPKTQTLKIWTYCI